MAPRKKKILKRAQKERMKRAAFRIARTQMKNRRHNDGQRKEAP